MADMKDDSQKFQSGNVYKKNGIDFSAIAKQAEQNGNRKPEQHKPKNNTAKKQDPDDKFKALLNAAINRDDEDEEDAFEFAPPKQDKAGHNKTERADGQKEVKAAPDKELEEKKHIPEVQEGNAPVQEPKEPESETPAVKPEEQPEVPKAQDVPETKPAGQPELNQEQAGDASVEEEPGARIKPQEPAKEPEKKDALPKVAAAVPKADKEGQLETLEEILARQEKTVQAPQENVVEKKVSDLILDGDALKKGKNLKKQFNPNPPEALIKGKDFNDPSLDDIYNYTYSEQMAELRERKAKERQEKIAAQIEEERKQEELKSKRQKKKEAKKKKYDGYEEIKPRKTLKVPPNYPKDYIDPTDVEIDEKTGKPYYYFNFTKTIQTSKLRFLEKIIPVAAIDDVLYDKQFLDGVADRQHDKTVRLNNMSAEEQYARDLKNTAIKIALSAAFVFAVFFKVTFGIIPDHKYATAISTMESQDYENAYYQFTELGNKELSVYFAKYSEAKMFFKVGRYQDAKEGFSMLLPFNEDIFKKRGINIEDEMNECDYQTALNYYYEGDFETAKNIFKEIHAYSDSTQRYYECGFKIAKDADENWQDNDDLKKALKYYYRVRKYSTEDVAGHIKRIQDTLYKDASDAYDVQNYEYAIDLFQYLAMFNYTSDDGVSSREMVYQCTYRYGLDLYKNRKYESARKVLSEIPEYKDSYVLSKECIYNIAKILYENNPVASIAEYTKIMGYRDSDTIRNSPRLIMYGEWNITEINGSAVNPVTFSFYDDGQFKTNKQILAVAISTGARPIYYEWDGEKFTAMDGEYTIVPKYDEETDKMELTCNSPGQQFDYRCVREKTYEEMVSESDDENKTQTAQETMNQKYQNLINVYIEKKMDHIVVINGESVDIFDGETD